MRISYTVEDLTTLKYIHYIVKHWHRSFLVVLLLNLGIWMVFSCCFPWISPTQSKGGILIVPVITYGSHDLTRVPPSWCRSGRLAVFIPCERRCAEAEALEGAQQVEAVVLAFAFGMNDLGELVGERHLPSNGPQVVGVLGTLSMKGKQKKSRVKGLDTGQRICLHYPRPW